MEEHMQCLNALLRTVKTLMVHQEESDADHSVALGELLDSCIAKTSDDIIHQHKCRKVYSPRVARSD